MGYRLKITPGSDPGSWILNLKVNLTRMETNDLFLSGDAMLVWTDEGLLPERGVGAARGLDRSGMFVSEVAARPSGLKIRFMEERHAARAAALLRGQLAQAGIEEES